MSAESFSCNFWHHPVHIFSGLGLDVVTRAFPCTVGGFFKTDGFNSIGKVLERRVKLSHDKISLLRSGRTWNFGLMHRGGQLSNRALAKWRSDPIQGRDPLIRS